jgi:hypothetical protein
VFIVIVYSREVNQNQQFLLNKNQWPQLIKLIRVRKELVGECTVPLWVHIFVAEEIELLELYLRQHGL